MRVQKISNLDQRLDVYRGRRRHWLQTEVPAVLSVCISVSTAFMYYRTTIDPGFDWQLWGLVFGVGFSVTPISVMRPKRPTQADVDDDIALRNAFNMDATVSGENSHR